MKKSLLVLVLLIASLNAENLTLKSSLQGQLEISQEANLFGCSGKNISPELSWSGAPKGTKSFAITMYDPDAPTGSGWWHWLVADIPKNTSKIEMGKKIKGAVEGTNDYGTVGFGGACPPKGDKAHQYIITIHALDTESLGIDAKTNAPIIGYKINAHTIAKSSIISYYQR